MTATHFAFAPSRLVWLLPLGMAALSAACGTSPSGVGESAGGASVSAFLATILLGTLPHQSQASNRRPIALQRRPTQRASARAAAKAARPVKCQPFAMPPASASRAACQLALRLPEASSGQANAAPPATARFRGFNACAK